MADMYRDLEDVRDEIEKLKEQVRLYEKLIEENRNNGTSSVFHQKTKGIKSCIYYCDLHWEARVYCGDAEPDLGRFDSPIEVLAAIEKWEKENG